MSHKLDPSVNQRFSTRMGLILSALGIAVGTGNIWRFPRIAAQTGGDEGAGAFLLAWLVFLFLWSIPLIIAEYALGRKFRSGVIGIFIKAVGKKLSWMGTFVAFVSTAIAFFYTVVVGWCIYYFIYTVSHSLPETTPDAMAVWNDYQNSNWPFLFHSLAVGLGALAIWKGIRSIERVNKILEQTPGINEYVCIGGWSLLNNVIAPNGAAYFVMLDPWDEREDKTLSVQAISQQVQGQLFAIQDAINPGRTLSSQDGQKTLDSRWTLTTQQTMSSCSDSMTIMTAGAWESMSMVNG